MTDVSKLAIVNILIKRDGISRFDAEEAVRETQEQITSVLACDGPLEELEGIIADNLGLEPDYLDAFWSNAG